MRMLIAGGGTGGHVFPGIALAEEVVSRHPANDVVFVGTARGLEATVVPAAGFPIELIDVKGLKGKGLARAPREPAPPPARVPPVVPDPAQVAAGRGGGRGRLRHRAGGAGGVAAAHPHRGAGAERGRRASPTGCSAGSSTPPSPPSPRRRATSPGARSTSSATPSAASCSRTSCGRTRSTTGPRLLVFGGSQGAHAPQHAGHRGAAAPRRPARASSASRTRPARATASRWRRATAPCGFEPDVREFIARHERGLRRGRPRRLPRRRHHARRADRLQEAVDPRPLPGRRRQPPGGERQEPGRRRRGGDDRGARPHRRAARRGDPARSSPTRSGASGWRAPPAGSGSPQAASEIADVCTELDRPPLGLAHGQRPRPRLPPRPPRRPA